MNDLDITLPCNDGIVNVRVGAIIIKDNKILMIKNKNVDYYYSIGGRIKFKENSKQAVIREVYEETNTKMEIDRLGFIYEGFFLGDSSICKNKLVYEIGFFYYMKVPIDFQPICKSLNNENQKEEITWLDINNLDKIKLFPEFFKTELKKPNNSIKYIFNNEKED